MSKLLKFIIIPYLIFLLLFIAYKNSDFFLSSDGNLFLADTKNVSGDVNGDGSVKSSDCLLVKKHLLKLSTLSGDSFKRADMNSDNKVTISDYSSIKKILLSGGGGKGEDEPKNNEKTLTATFTIQDTDNVTSSSTSVSCKTTGKSCEITAPTLTSNNSKTKAIGWNTDKKATAETVKSGDKITISKNAKYYSISSTLVNVTFDVGRDIPNENTKAQSLSFYNNEYTKCTSYNGVGCNIRWVPAIISPGNTIHGFSLTPDGDIINVAKTKYKKDTTLYARIYDSVWPGYYNIVTFKYNKSELIGNVLVVVEDKIDEKVANEYIKFVKELYEDFPGLLMWNGTLYLFSNRTYCDRYGSDSGGITLHGSGFTNGSSHVAVRYSSGAGTYHLGSTVHEITHAYNYALTWGGGLSSAISKTEDIKNLYSKYKSSFPNGRSNASEFYSEAMRAYYYKYRKNVRGDKPYSNISGNGWNDEIASVLEKYIQVGLDYYRGIGRL